MKPSIPMVATVSAGTTASYYTQAASAYYIASSQEAAGYWAAAGADFGIEVGAPVDAATFERLHAALDLEGRSLIEFRHGAGRVGGYDITFSAPKSCSILWGLGDETLRQRIEAAQAAAVDAALLVLSSHATWCRSGKNGLRLEAVQPTAAVFLHGESRPEVHADGEIFADPQLHSHAVVVNLGQKADGRFGALDGRLLFKWKMALGATYHAELAKRLQDIGFSITDAGRNGIFEIAGVDKKLIRYFSARRSVVEDGLAEAGTVSGHAPALAASIARNTRNQKQSDNTTDRFMVWQNRAADLGFEAHRVLEAAIGHDRCQQLDARDIDQLVDDRLSRIPSSLTEHESTFDRRELHAAVAAALVGTGADAARVEAAIAKFEQDQGIAVLDQDSYGHPIYSTPELLAIEREIGEIAARLSHKPVAKLNSESVNAAIRSAGLNAQQAAGARAATADKALTVLEGAPGTGKTSLLRPVVEEFQAAGYRVIGSATAWRIAEELHRDLGIQARATDSWLAHETAGGHFLDDRTVLIVDEAGLLSSRQMHALLGAADRAAAGGQKSPRILLVGDRNQLQSVGAGSGLRLVADVLSVNRVETIVRQKQQWARDAVTDFGAGRASEALAAYQAQKLFTEAVNARAGITALVDAWQKAHTTDPDRSQLIIARTNAQVRTISDEVRHRLRTVGDISGEDVSVETTNRAGQHLTLPLAVGDHVRFLVRAQLDDAEVVNGTEARIVSIHRDDDHRVNLTVDTGKQSVRLSSDQIADADGRVLLAHAYASTIYGAQGLTVDKAFVWVTPEMDRHDIYVATSRARLDTHLFTDRQALDARISAELPLDQRANVSNIDPSARLVFLGQQLARPGLKRTTLDVLLAARARAEQGLGAKASLEQRNVPNPLTRQKRRQTRELSLD